MASLSDDDFAIFGLPRQFALDDKTLTASYLKLQNQTHPDRFADGTPAEKRLAVQWATRVNEAYKRLSNPMDRALYLCELNGEDPRGRQSNLPPALLMQQIEWRETLEETKTEDGLEELLDEVMAEKKRCLSQIAKQLDTERDFSAANGTAHALLFVDKFITEVKKHLEYLEDAK